MAFTYCKSCGYKNMYTLSVPKFCGGCGKELGEMSSAKKIPLGRSPEPVEDDFDPDGLDVFSVPKITKLSYSIEHDSSNKMKLEDLIPLEELEKFDERDEGGSEKAKPSPKRAINGKRKTKKS
jgi:hypothetical protein